MIRKFFLQKGIAQIPVILGLLIIGVALPAALRLTQDQQEARSGAAGVLYQCMEATGCNQGCSSGCSFNDIGVYSSNISVGCQYDPSDGKYSMIICTLTSPSSTPTSTPTIAYPITISPTVTPTNTPTLTPAPGVDCNNCGEPYESCCIGCPGQNPCVSLYLCDAATQTCKPDYLFATVTPAPTGGSCQPGDSRCRHDGTSWYAENCVDGGWASTDCLDWGYSGCQTDGDGNATCVNPVVSTTTPVPTDSPTSLMCCDKCDGCIQCTYHQGVTSCPSGKTECSSCGGGRPDSNYLRNFRVILNPNNETDSDRFDVKLVVEANCTVEYDGDNISFMIGPTEGDLVIGNVGNVRSTDCSWVSDNSDNDEDSGTRTYACTLGKTNDNGGARNASGWEYEGGPFWVRVENNLGCSPFWSDKVYSAGVSPLPTPNPNCDPSRSCLFDDWFAAYSSVGGFGRATIEEGTTNPSDINCDRKVDLIDFNLMQHGCLSAPGVPVR